MELPLNIRELVNMKSLKKIFYITKFSYPNFFSKLHCWQGTKNTLPSIFEIIFTKNRYKVDVLMKKELGIRYKLLKLLGKVTTYKDQIYLFVSALISNKYKTIYILPAGILIDEIISFHLDKISRDETLFIKLDLHKNSEKIKNQITFFKHILVKEKNNIRYLGKIICINCISYEFLHILNMCIDAKNISVKYNDMIEGLNRGADQSIDDIILKIKQYSSIVKSYSMTDCRKYNLSYEPNIVNKDNLREYITTVSKKAIFVGILNKARIDILEEIIERLVTECYFVEIYTYNISDVYIQNKINSIKNKYKEFVIFNLDKFIDYFSYIKIISEAEIIIDVYRLSSSEGNSYRVYETFAMGKILITNRDLSVNENIKTFKFKTYRLNNNLTYIKSNK